MKFDEQLSRIKTKLEKLKSKDKDLQVFGADSHQYEIDSPATLDDILEFENKYDVRLPEEYIAFITNIGNGGLSYDGGGAGPYYGIYPLGEFGYMQIDKESMSSPSVINSGLTQNNWEDMTAFSQGGVESIENDRKYKELFNGMMSLGTRGCSGQTMLIVKGDDYGRVAYIDQDLYLPSLPAANNFLDWYEQWLDENLKA
ncbi:MAG: SMI1/KNR4 family protein [Cyclobacteriaceae bacterium]|nr:SMI1/KNR4 family protein [Cyclobacteriaceae bacterium]